MNVGAKKEMKQGGFTKMKNKKAQAVLEFLMIWGWLIMAIIVVICVILYFSQNQEPHFRIIKEGNEIDEIGYDRWIYFDEGTIDEMFRYCETQENYCFDKGWKERNLTAEDCHKEYAKCIDFDIGYYKKATISKQNLTPDWLEENCECVEFVKRKLPTKCQKYKCGSYFVESWEQIK